MKGKKLVALFLSVVLALMLCVPVMAAEPQATCNHTTVKRSAGTTYSLYTSTQHHKTTKYNYVCTKCGVVVSTDTVRTDESHSLSYTGSGTHNYANSTHTWTKVCGACGYSVSETRPCSGPPCASPV